MPFTKPCFKRFLHVKRLGTQPAPSSNSQQTISIHYGRERGVMLEEIDEAQLLLLSQLDGRHSFEDIVNTLQQHHPQVTTEEVSEALEELLHFGLLEDAAIEPPAALLPSDLERYSSQIHFLSLLDASGTQKYVFQAKLKQARVAVLGLGGLGSNVLLGLAAIGVGFLRGVDGDQVELGNLNRQVLYEVNDLGKPKVHAAAEQLARFNPNVQFEPVQQTITSSQQLGALIEGADLVVFCADQPREITSWMNQTALQREIPFIMGGYHGAGAEVGPFVVPFQTACLACVYTSLDPDEGTVEELAWIEQAAWLRHPNIHFVTALSAHLICAEICKYLLGNSEPATYNHRYLLDLQQFTLTANALIRDSNCPQCANRSSPNS
ncbi:TOMM precursor leader peptide-binding protein [Ktedonospora formicarum]|uniref:Thiamine/molybdopterin biosynthesis protein n=1 Tax=Ktedonospora formicarum TaxID=2778364 RepID=A0A8J3MVS1_9CHLR|nr:TOMM precursor leader peptide-binding protein [Ktedonospora formicarum]GHO50637.1 thiamine/molybdopterin biosynthesis protein [Ktedonospora formicarum]